MAYCKRCSRSFPHRQALAQHKRDSYEHHICDDCDIDFASRDDLEEHWIDDPDHAYCQSCEEHFDDDEELEDHYESEHSYCRDCERFFKNDHSLKQHYRQSKEHHYCFECDRHFQNENNLRNHLNSSTHRPKDVKCPFRGCGMKFVSRSALVLHLEGGKCASGVDRKAVNRYVRQYDKNNIITDPSRLISYDSDDDEPAYIATKRAWNGSAFECYLCQSEHSTLKGLNQHLASPRHLNQAYICRWRECQSRFSTLSALVQHIESEKCGVSKFKVVQRSMDRILGQMKALTL